MAGAATHPECFAGIHTAFAPGYGVVPKAVMTTGRGLADKAKRDEYLPAAINSAFPLPDCAHAPANSQFHHRRARLGCQGCHSNWRPQPQTQLTQVIARRQRRVSSAVEAIFPECARLKYRHCINLLW